MNVEGCDMDQPGRLAALRVVLVVALGPVEASILLSDGEQGGTVCQWPSTVYRGLARAMTPNSTRWQITARYIDKRLARELRQFEGAAPADIAAALSDYRDAFSADELAALLWSMVRLQEPAVDSLLARVAAEVEVVLMQHGVSRRIGARSSSRPANCERPAQLAS